ncbi:MAG: DUF1499 domain-containing protein [Gammaproteobacteria bacterium]|nr:DUF1499 domain-containing protein [Gammaproteobacteria bacterium]
MEQNQFSACPDKPNCVSSMSSDSVSRIEPFRYTGDSHSAKQLLIEIIKNLPRTKIVKQDGDYLHITFTSMIFRFVDDVTFLFVDNEKLIHVKSASRVGRSDFGVNRKRVEMLRKVFNSKMAGNQKNEMVR